MEVRHAKAGEGLAMEALREMLLTLGSLKGLVPETPPAAMPPHNHDWLIPLSFLVVAVASLTALSFYFVFRCSKCRQEAGGGDKEALMLDHECAIACLVLVLFVVCSLGSFYYYYCFRAGCFGTGGLVMAKAAPPGGRKLLQTATAW